jgi:hypothetical protein
VVLFHSRWLSSNKIPISNPNGQRKKSEKGQGDRLRGRAQSTIRSENDNRRAKFHRRGREIGGRGGMSCIAKVKGRRRLSEKEDHTGRKKKKKKNEAFIQREIR